MVIWVDVTKSKRPPRKAARRRFENIKVGDQLMRRYVSKWTGSRNGQKAEGSNETVWYYIVTDLWFDPVRGNEKRDSGEMVAIQRLRENGEPVSHKEGHSIRGLAANSFQYADIDYIQFCKDRMEALKEGKVVGISHGRAIRRRPKLPSTRF